MEDLSIFVFVRNDLQEEDQMVQALHGMFEMVSLCKCSNALHRVITLDGGNSQKAFNKTIKKLSEKQIPFVAYSDPDHDDWGFTSLVTTPLTKEQSLSLSNYRLRRYSPVAQRKSIPEKEGSGVQVLPGEPIASVAQ